MGVTARLLRAGVAWAFIGTGCSHSAATSPTSPTASERREEWLAALRSDVDRLAEADGFHGQLRVLHDGKAELERTFRPAECLPLGVGRRLLSTLAMALLVQDGVLDFEDRLDRRLPSAAGTSLANLSVANLLTGSAGLAPTTGATLDERLDAAEKLPLRGAGTRVDPADDRPWRLLERVVAHVAGEPYAAFIERRVFGPAGLRDTTLGRTTVCADSTDGTTTVDDQFRLIEALRAGTLVRPSTRDALWTPRLPLGAGLDVGYGFVLRSNGEQRAVGLASSGQASAYELWLDPSRSDALVLLGQTSAHTARSVRTALAEFYALPPGPPSPASAPRR